MRQELVDGDFVGMGQVTIVRRDGRVEIELTIGDQPHDGCRRQHLGDGSDVEPGVRLIGEHVGMNRIPACRRKDGVTVMCNEHGARKSIGGCLGIYQNLHFFH